MKTILATKELMEHKQVEKLRMMELEQKQLEEDFEDVVLTKQQKIAIRENTWHKLYLLQNYNVTMEMFKGAQLRWSSIYQYLTLIRAIYKGCENYKELPTKSLRDYIQGLMDSGVEPYPVPENLKGKIVSIPELLDSKILAPYQTKYIFASVGETEELPDTSSAWTQSHYEREFETNGGNHSSYVSIVENMTVPTMLETQTNPITMLSNKLAKAIKLTNKKDIFSIYKKAFSPTLLK